MTHVSRPLIALLVGTVLFFALWIVALKPSGGSSSSSGSGGLGQYQSAINAAKQSVKLQDGQGARDGTVPGTSTTAAGSGTAAESGKSATGSAHATNAKAGAKADTQAKPHASARAHATTRSHATTHHKGHVVVHKVALHAPTAGQGLNIVSTALREHKVLAILFYNPAGADDMAVKNELDSIPTYRGQVVKLVVPVSELARYTAITTQVLVSTTPELVLVDRSLQATVITGFASRFEIATRVANAVETR